MALHTRIGLAIALTVAFYLLALVIGVGLIAAPIALYASTGKGNIWIAIGLIAAGFTVLRAIVPARHRFDPPGPALTADDQPRLHRLLAETGERMGEPVPDRVYLDADVNASVTELPRGGGRVLLLGLPLMAALTPGELRAVVGHELGHYTGGDTRYSSWIWRTRVAVIRTVVDLEESESAFRSTVVRLPFLLYAKGFERLTNAVSRRQEFAADAAAATAAGADAAGTALRRVSAAGAAYGSYWQTDVAYLLERGSRPPIAQGFAGFLGGSQIAPALDEVVAADVSSGDPDPYASHPTLGERLEALGVVAEGAPPAIPFAESAAGLLEGLEGLEYDLLRTQFGDEATSDLTEADWDDLGAQIQADWHELRDRAGDQLDGLTVARAAEAVIHPEPHRPLLKAALGEGSVGVNGSELDAVAPAVFGALVGRALYEAGFELAVLPGEPVSCRRGDLALAPEGDLVAVAESGDAAAWTSRVEDAGVADLRL